MQQKNRSIARSSIALTALVAVVALVAAIPAADAVTSRAGPEYENCAPKALVSEARCIAGNWIEFAEYLVRGEARVE